MTRDDGALLERAGELAEIAERLAAARRGTGGVLLIEGAAGIGKTRLVRAAVDRARAYGMIVLAARGGELERGMSFGVVRELFEAAVHRAPDRDRLLAGAAGLAASVLAAVPPGGDEGAVGGLHGLYWLTVNLAERGPLLVAVDDVHWADDASLRFLVYLVRRLEALPLLLVVAGRADEPGADEVLLEALRADPLTTALHPAPLSETAAAVVVRRAFSPRADDRLCRACHTATDGNPLLLRMLAHVLRDEGVDPAAGDARVGELAPQVVAATVLPRLRRLSADAGALAAGVAVLGERTELRHAAALAGLGAGPATRAADTLVAAGILASGRPLEFAHPTVRRAVYESLPAAEHHRAHRRAAEVLDAEGAPADRIAAHLLMTERLGDPWVVEILRAAARQALARGGVEEVAQYLRRALEEPPSPEVRAAVLVELGSVSAQVRISDAYRYLREALEFATDVRHRAGIALELARVLATARDLKGALAVLDEAVAELGEVDPGLRLRLEAEYLSVARRFPAAREEATRRLRALADRAEPSGLAGCMLLANLAADALEEAGDAAAATRLAEAALREDHLVAGGETDAALMASAVLMATDRLDAARRTWNAEIDQARRCGSMVRFAFAATVRACLAYRCGDLADAEADARLAEDIHREQGMPLGRRYSLAFLVGALVERGEVDAAAERLDAADVPVNLTLLLDSRGRLRAAQGRFAEALGDFLESGSRLAARGTRHPGMLAWRSNAALALLRLDQTDEARRLADEELDLARRLGVPRALGIALRGAGLVRGGAAGLELLRQAAAVLARSAARLDEAKALADLGAALRRANRRTDAREPLRRALDLALRCGAAPVAARAREELGALGIRPRRAASGVEALTPSELRVARMAADGMGNRAIAQALFVTIKTVEVHLGSAYRKLAVPSRARLAAALAEDKPDRTIVTRR
jgi:DNA-binding CsgD family transcriptional regulator